MAKRGLAGAHDSQRRCSQRTRIVTSAIPALETGSNAQISVGGRTPLGQLQAVIRATQISQKRSFLSVTSTRQIHTAAEIGVQLGRSQVCAAAVTSLETVRLGI